MKNKETVSYPTRGQLDDLRRKADSLGYQTQINADINLLGQALSRSLAPSKTERVLWKELRVARKRQAQWRSANRSRFKESMFIPDGLGLEKLQMAAKLFVCLKERGASYGDYVFNFAFPEKTTEYPATIILPTNFPEKIWYLAQALEEMPLGLPMARVDVIRQPDNRVKIIEINPCWVDNIGALQAFYDIYGLGSFTKPIKIFSEQLANAKSRGPIGLAYCDQTTSCQRDEIYCLAAYLEATSRFTQVVVSPLRDLRLADSGCLVTKSNIVVSTLYFDGSFTMTNQSAGEQKAVEAIIQAQQQGLLLAPSQFRALDQKDSLEKLYRLAPDTFINTSTAPPQTSLPVVAKPISSESLNGVRILETKDEFSLLNDPSKYIFQPLTVSTTQGLVCVDNRARRITQPDALFEKICIWISSKQVLGVMATYGQTPLINDAGFNLPLRWKEV